MFSYHSLTGRSPLLNLEIFCYSMICKSLLNCLRSLPVVFGAVLGLLKERKTLALAFQCCKQ